MSLKTVIKPLVKAFLPKSFRTTLKKATKVKLRSAGITFPKNDFDKAVIKNEIAQLSHRPLISVIIPCTGHSGDLFRTIHTLKKQLYTNWELCVITNHSLNIITRLQAFLFTRRNILFLKQKNNSVKIFSQSNVGFPSGEYITILNKGDELLPYTLFEIVKSIIQTKADFLYSDEDKIDQEGNLSHPFYKPDFSIDLLLSQNYIASITVLKKELLIRSGGILWVDEKLNLYDLFLNCSEKATIIHHIQKILCHRKFIPHHIMDEPDPTGSVQMAGKKSLEAYLQRNNIRGIVLNGSIPQTYRIKREIKGNPLVSIIIPFKDKPELLKTCIDSILTISSYQNFEIIGVNNNSTQQPTFDLLADFEKRDSRIKFHDCPIPFNFSKLNNIAAEIAKGEHLILLNNDIEITSPEWIEAMLEHSQRPEVGAVGAKLYYPNDTIQHAGVILGIAGLAGHAHKHLSKTAPGYFGRAQLIQNISAVTAACLMVSKKLYEEAGGLDETNLAIAYNDVDFCLRLREMGYLNVFTTYAEAYHHESISRGTDNSPEHTERFNREVAYMKNRHQKILENGDPYYNPHLTITAEDFSLK